MTTTTTTNYEPGDAATLNGEPVTVHGPYGDLGDYLVVRADGSTVAVMPSQIKPRS